jgi:hypothetical protein
MLVEIIAPYHMVVVAMPDVISIILKEVLESVRATANW